MCRTSMTIRSIVIAGLLLACSNSDAQNPGDSPKGEAVLVKLAAPIYPPLARATWISGDVELILEIRQDGSIASTTAAKGHPLLVQAALDSAKQSQFDCKSCGADGVSYRLLYSFVLVTDGREASEQGGQKAQPLPRFKQEANRVTIFDHALIISDPAPDRLSVRSAKCLYLWKCKRVL